MDERPQSDQLRTTQPLVRTVNNLKNTTTNIRGFADSMDHLLNAFEEFFPFIERVAQKTEKSNPESSDARCPAQRISPPAALKFLGKDE